MRETYTLHTHTCPHPKYGEKPLKHYSLVVVGIILESLYDIIYLFCKFCRGKSCNAFYFELVIWDNVSIKA
jgi:hypothetical protein